MKGGIEGHINQLANGLKQKGIDVEVLVSNTSVKFEKEIIDGISVTKVPQIGRFASASLNMTFSFWIKRLGEKADILHFHFPNPTAEMSYMISGVRKNVIVTYHSDIVRQARLAKLYAPFLKKFLEQAKTIIVTSPNYLKSSPFLSEFQNKCSLIPFGIDLADFLIKPDQNTKIAQIRSTYGERILLFIGRFRYYKGLHVLIEAMKKIDSKLLLIGAGPIENSLKQLVHRLHLEEKIVFLGELSDEEKILHLHACDVFVLPSIFRSEAFGIVQLEAMACSKPVVCTELGTGTSFVNQNEKTGLVVSPGDTNTLADAINRLLSKTRVREEYGKAGFERVQKYFSKEKMIQNTISVYQRALRQPVIVYSDQRAIGAPCFPDRKIKVLRIISRLNIGGPAIHAYLLTKGLDNNRFETIVITGKLSSFEGDMSYLFDALDNKPIFIPDLQRELSPWKDLKAFVQIFKILYEKRPDIVHTHTTKAGASARIAVFLYSLFGRRKIRTVHTFHGHVFTGYFNRTVSWLIVRIERLLMRLTDVVIAISESQQWELKEKYRIAPAYKIKTKELGFDLKPFLNNEGKKGSFRRDLGIKNNTLLIGIIGRLVPIKNHKMFLETARCFITRNPGLPVKFVIVGDGELRNQLKAYARKLRIEPWVLFYGWVKDVSYVYSDLDILALTSLNEGTPVSIIEAMASSVPVIATDAGGVVDLIGTGNAPSSSNGFRVCDRGILCRKDDPVGFAEGLKYLISIDDREKNRMLSKACRFVKRKYSHQRLLKNIEELYLELADTTN
ncbi:MAG: glycosyltransferase [Deltaproteobacteria bacterium]|nr:glycosyltransferase [Deltaproteobacteria bacterium]MBW2152791.1 glycosyltransferase [Deltaproteobacteria bacterium]